MENLLDGDRLLPVLLQDLDSATRSIHVAMFLFFDDSMGEEISGILEAKARAGVAVRTLAREIRATVKVDALHVDHRKIVTIDCRVAYCGSANFRSLDAVIAAAPLGMRVSSARVIKNEPSSRTSEIRETFRERILAAEQWIFIENPFLYHPAIVGALRVRSRGPRTLMMVAAREL